MTSTSKHHPLTVLSSLQLLTPCSQAHALQDETGCEKKEASLEGKDTDVRIPVPTPPNLRPSHPLASGQMALLSPGTTALRLFLASAQ